MGYGYDPTPKLPASLVNVFISLHRFLPIPLPLPHAHTTLYTDTLYTAARLGLELCPFGGMGHPSPLYVSYFFSSYL